MNDDFDETMDAGDHELPAGLKDVTPDNYEEHEDDHDDLTDLPEA